MVSRFDRAFECGGILGNKEVEGDDSVKWWREL
jgi:hypothetical protein